MKLLTPLGSLKKQESSRKTSALALLTMPMPFPVWITTNWKILKEMVIQDHLNCLLTNLSAGQETVRTRRGTMDWFQIGKGECHSGILSLCLFNLYAEYMLQEPCIDPWVGKIPWRRERLPTPGFWPRAFHGWHGISLWGRKELDTTVQHSLSLFIMPNGGLEEAQAGIKIQENTS